MVLRKITQMAEGISNTAWTVMEHRRTARLVGSEMVQKTQLHCLPIGQARQVKDWLRWRRNRSWCRCVQLCNLLWIRRFKRSKNRKVTDKLLSAHAAVMLSTKPVPRIIASNW